MQNVLYISINDNFLDYYISIEDRKQLIREKEDETAFGFTKTFFIKGTNFALTGAITEKKVMELVEKEECLALSKPYNKKSSEELLLGEKGDIIIKTIKKEVKVIYKRRLPVCV